jgi:hypothetical protein
MHVSNVMLSGLGAQRTIPLFMFNTHALRVSIAKTMPRV